MADIRRNHRDLTGPQKSAFVNAVLALKNDVDSVLHPGNQKRYDDYVEIHMNAMMGPGMFEPMPHGSSLFFPWHRILLRQFELDLQKAANDPAITLPYWDWSQSNAGTPFTADFLGGDGDRAQGGRVTSGPFAYATGKFRIVIADNAQDDPGLRREFGEDSAAYLPTPAQVSSGLGRIPYWGGSSCFERVLETSLHNPVHNWVGGNMAEATSPNDPVFFLHHAYIDLLWDRWKGQHPTLPPYLPTAGAPSRDLDAMLVFNAPNEPAPWQAGWTVRQTIDPAELGYSYA